MKMKLIFEDGSNVEFEMKNCEVEGNPVFPYGITNEDVEKTYKMGLIMGVEMKVKDLAYIV